MYISTSESQNSLITKIMKGNTVILPKISEYSPKLKPVIRNFIQPSDKYLTKFRYSKPNSSTERLTLPKYKTKQLRDFFVHDGAKQKLR